MSDSQDHSSNTTQKKTPAAAMRNLNNPGTCAAYLLSVQNPTRTAASKQALNVITSTLQLVQLGNPKVAFGALKTYSYDEAGRGKNLDEIPFAMAEVFALF